MIRSKQIEISSMIACSIFFMLGFLFIQRWILAILPVLCGLIWIISTHQFWRGAGPFLLISASTLAGFAVLEGADPFLLAFSTIFAIFAWDLFEFRKRVLPAEKAIEGAAIERNHLIRLAWMGGLACVCVSLVSEIQIQFNFFISFFLGLMLIISITQFIQRIR